MLQLVDEGKLSLDDSVNTHLPDLETGNHDGTSISIRDLLQHTSGLANFTTSASATPETLPAPDANPDELVTIAMGLPANFAPGTAWGYSRTDYLLAGMVIEAVTGSPWDQEARDRITQPLGLAQTTVGENPENPDPSWARADGGLISTPQDLTRFFAVLLGNELFAPEQLTVMQESVETILGDDSRYGLGIEWRPLSCGEGYWGQQSTEPGYQSHIGVTEDNVRILVLSNASFSVDAIAANEQAGASLVLIDNALCGSG